MEKANEYAVESLKQIITLASAILALTITFLKDVLGDERGQAHWAWLVPCGWVSLLFSIVLAWFAIVGAADKLGNATAVEYVFKSDKSGTTPHPEWLFIALSWFIPTVQTRQNNLTRKFAASAQHYFVLGLLLLGLFAVLNLNSAFRKNASATQGPAQKQSTPSPIPTQTATPIDSQTPPAITTPTATPRPK